MKKFYLIASLCLSMDSIAQTPKMQDLLTFTKPAFNPILKADTSLLFFDSLKNEMVRWQRADVFNPAAIVRKGRVYLFTRSEDNPAAGIGGRTSRIGLAVSKDGLHFKHYPKPVLYPRQDTFMQYDYPGGCEDPRVVETEDGMYVMAYTSWNYKTPRLSIAISKDLVNWEKKGPAFATAYSGKYLDKASKSASMITSMQNGRPMLQKVNGKYWMYWGEAFVNLAWSNNLYDWYPLQDNNAELTKVIQTRPGKFDSDLTECGPPALVTKEGILLLYNGKNAGNENADSLLPKNTYTVGYVLLDKKDMQTVISRAEKPILKPTLTHEVTGQYKAGTIFSEGLVFFKRKWFLYYGTADSFVGVAITK
jgi:beta-1,2-mannosidase